MATYRQASRRDFQQRAAPNFRCDAPHMAAQVRRTVNPRFLQGRCVSAVACRIFGGRFFPSPPPSILRISRADQWDGRADNLRHDQRRQKRGRSGARVLPELVRSLRNARAHKPLSLPIAGLDCSAAQRSQARHDAQRGLFGAACGRDRAKADMPRNDSAVAADARSAWPL
jgi:hypothetical protein